MSQAVDKLELSYIIDHYQLNPFVARLGQVRIITMNVVIGNNGSLSDYTKEEISILHILVGFKLDKSINTNNLRNNTAQKIAYTTISIVHNGVVVAQLLYK